MNELGRGLRFLRICLVIVCEFGETTVSSEKSGAGRETERQRERREGEIERVRGWKNIITSKQSAQVGEKTNGC